MDSFKNVRFYFITNDSLNEMRTFHHHYGLTKYVNILVGRDERFFFPSHFPSVAPPYMVLYDKNKQLRAILGGETNTEVLLKLIHHL